MVVVFITLKHVNVFTVFVIWKLGLALYCYASR